jgi:hypothetical protein
MARAPSIGSLLALALLYRLVTVGLLELAAALLLLFDPAPDAFLPRSSALQPFVRWDVLWFLPVALRGGYMAEQETAFGSGWIWTMRALGRVVRTLREGGQGQDPSVEDVVLGGMVGSWLAGLTATALLYEYVTTSPRSPLPFAHERAEPANLVTLSGSPAG